MAEFKHFPVMLKEVLEALNCRKGKVYIDATLGGGGYSEAILEQIQPEGKLLSFDVDEEAIDYCKQRLNKYKNITIIKDSHVNIERHLRLLNTDEITGGVVYDFGASFHQLTSESRGFSFQKEAMLDMRFDKEADFSAYDIVNKYREENLVKIFSEYGEERFSKRIAKGIVQARKKKSIKTTKELVDIILGSTPRVKSKIHPATKVFQAIRIEVNGELENIKKSLVNIMPYLGDGAIIVTVTFHSLEDRIVKNFFKENSAKFPGGNLEIHTRKPITATDEEIKVNPASRSAKLRYAQVIKREI